MLRSNQSCRRCPAKGKAEARLLQAIDWRSLLRQRVVACAFGGNVNIHSECLAGAVGMREWNSVMMNAFQVMERSAVPTVDTDLALAIAKTPKITGSKWRW